LSERRDISMSEAEVDAFLARCPQMVVGAIAADGWPTGTIAATSYAAGELRVRFAAADDPVLVELPRDPHVCCVADEHPSYYEIRGVMVHGRIDGAGASGDAPVALDRIVSFDFGRLQ
jgi:nitroimidazol reductase NimA-like FMN-containing flavoprotein (pyridoxamine 5'-phosphate oxidase superfamily)